MSLLEEFEFVHQHKHDSESLIDQALVDVKRSIFRRIDDMENMSSWQQNEEFKVIGQLVADNLRDHIEARHADLLREIRLDNDMTFPVSIDPNQEHIDASKKESGLEFSRAHNDALGART